MPNKLLQIFTEFGGNVILYTSKNGVEWNEYNHDISIADSIWDGKFVILHENGISTTIDGKNLNYLNLFNGLNLLKIQQ